MEDEIRYFTIQNTREIQGAPKLSLGCALNLTNTIP